MNEWNYHSKTSKSTGYEDCKELEKYTHTYYNNLTEREKEKVIDIIFNIYRSKNIFPITYYNKKAVLMKYKNVLIKMFHLKTMN